MLALCFGSRQFHWDTLERAYLLEHAARYMHTWDGTPRSQFLSFAHVLELPAAWIVRSVLRLPSGLEALCVLEALVAGATLGLLGALVRFWSADTRAALLAQATLGTSMAFWKMGSSGEEKILARATQLLFLLLFWRALATGSGTRWAAVTLAVAILSHLTGAVLVPFSILALLFLPAEWKAQRLPVARALAIGAVAAFVAYYAVAAWTTHVRGLGGFVEYLTFFHRRGGIDFFEPTGAVGAARSRLVRVASGIAAFFGSRRGVGGVAVVVLVAWILVALRAGRQASPGRPLRTLRLQALLLAVLWSSHFVFYEPENHESWTLLATLLVLVAATSLPRGRGLWFAAVFPGALLALNLSQLAGMHRPGQMERQWRAIQRAARPQDIVVVVGGAQGNKPLLGSIWMRYFLAHERERPVVSLYDILGVSQPEYWDRPFGSPAALQAALDAGRRAYFPWFLRSDIDRANESGIVHVTYAPVPGDSLYEIRRVEAGIGRAVQSP